MTRSTDSRPYCTDSRPNCTVQIVYRPYYTVQTVVEHTVRYRQVLQYKACTWFKPLKTTYDVLLQAIVFREKQRFNYDGDGRSMYAGPISIRCRASTCWHGAPDVFKN